jgi:hypothetical protein
MASGTPEAAVRLSSSSSSSSSSVLVRLPSYKTVVYTIYLSTIKSTKEKKRKAGLKRTTRGFIHSFSEQKQAAEPKQKEEQTYIRRIYKSQLNPTNQN